MLCKSEQRVPADSGDDSSSSSSPFSSISFGISISDDDLIQEFKSDPSSDRQQWVFQLALVMYRQLQSSNLPSSLRQSVIQCSSIMSMFFRFWLTEAMQVSDIRASSWFLLLLSLQSFVSLRLDNRVVYAAGKLELEIDQEEFLSGTFHFYPFSRHFLWVKTWISSFFCHVS